MKEAVDAQCTCSGDAPGALFASLKWVIEWRDENELFFKGSKNLIGEFAYKMFTGNFSNRRQTLFFGGEAGSGKSSVLNIFLNVVPKERIFTPTYESAFPFSKMKPWHVIGNYQEFRLMPKWSPSTTLLILERSENVQIDVKHEASFTVAQGPRNIMSSNTLTPKGPWTQHDITAILDRVMPARWDLHLPSVQSKFNVLECTCKRCSVELMMFCSPQLAAELAR